MKKKKDDFKPGSYGCHEAFHMALHFAEQIERCLVEHPAIVLNPAWRKKAQQAADILQELYQDIGREHC